MTNFDGLLRSQVARSYDLLGCATVTITRTTKGTDYDPATGSSPESKATQTIKAKFDSAWRTLGYKFGPDLVKTGDIAVTVPALGLTFDPSQGDKLTSGPNTYTVVDVRPSFAPGGLPTEFTMLVRL